MFSVTLLAFIACESSLDGLSAVDELTLSAASAKEEALLDGEDSVAAAMPAAEASMPFAECDALGRFDELKAGYDADGNGELSASEEEAVLAAREDRGSPAARHLDGIWHVLGLVYDLDLSRSLDDAERATLLADMTLRCDAIQARLLADYDLDGDGTLNDEEQAAALADLEAAFAEGHEGTCPDGEMGPPPGDSGERMGAPPSGGEAPAWMDLGELAVPPPLQSYDTDGDGLFSDTELTAMRTSMRAVIQSGEPLFDAFEP